MAALAERLPVLFVAGPTAVGKSEVALLLARQFGGEIVSADSMQVYQGLDIGTAKPSPAERAAVPHHLIDMVACHESFDAARFLALARAAMVEIRTRGRLPIVCGGTGLYFKALLEGLGDAPRSDPALRLALERLPLETLLSELQERDPETFARIDRRNPRRVIRAVEVLRLTGCPLSNTRAPWRPSGSGPSAAAPGDPAPVVFGLRRAPVDLRTRIDARVEQMFARGLVQETERLLAAGLGSNPTACQAIGYRQVIEFLRGARGLPETIELVKVKTRQFAKRQMTWLRGQLPVAWIDVGRDELAEAVAGRIWDRFKPG